MASRTIPPAGQVCAWRVLDLEEAHAWPRPIYFIARTWFEAREMARMFFKVDVPNDSTWLCEEGDARAMGNSSYDEVRRDEDGSLSKVTILGPLDDDSGDFKTDPPPPLTNGASPSLDDHEDLLRL